MIAADQQSTTTVTSEASLRYRAALEYALTGDLRFLAHHDELRMLTRALRRAAWPLAYSRGYNPQPRLSIALPRPVGTASLCQLALVRLDAAWTADQLAKQLAPVLPRGLKLTRISAPATLAGPQPERVEFSVALEPSVGRDALAERITTLLAIDALPFERQRGPGKASRPMDLRPFVQTLTFVEQSLRMTLRYIDGKCVRPAEVVAALGLDADEYKHRAQLERVEWNVALSAPATEAAALEGSDCGERNQEDDA